jgi:hypothetical protein
MHARAYENLPGMDGMALGFYEESRNGHRIIGHGGDTQYFHSDLHLVFDAGLGFFISYNSAGKGEISGRSAVWHKFLDRYFPYTPPAGDKVASAAQDAEMVSGHYIVSRRSQTTILKVGALAGQTKVYTNKDGTISVDGFDELSGQPKHFREIAPLVFRNVNDQDRIAFKREESGRLRMVIYFPAMVFEQASLGWNSAFNLPLLVFCLVVFVVTLVLWPVAALVRWHYGRKLELTPQQRRLRLAVRLVCLLDVIFVGAFVGTFMAALKDIGMLSDRMDWLFRLIQLVGWLGVLGTLAALYAVIKSWADKGRWLWSKLGDTAIALACVLFVWFVFNWNGLTFSLNY